MNGFEALFFGFFESGIFCEFFFSSFIFFLILLTSNYGQVVCCGGNVGVTQQEFVDRIYVVRVVGELNPTGE